MSHVDHGSLQQQTPKKVVTIQQCFSIQTYFSSKTQADVDYNFFLFLLVSKGDLMFVSEELTSKVKMYLLMERDTLHIMQSLQLQVLHPLNHFYSLDVILSNSNTHFCIVEAFSKFLGKFIQVLQIMELEYTGNNQNLLDLNFVFLKSRSSAGVVGSVLGYREYYGNFEILETSLLNLSKRYKTSNYNFLKQLDITSIQISLKVSYFGLFETLGQIRDTVLVHYMMGNDKQ